MKKIFTVIAIILTHLFLVGQEDINTVDTYLKNGIYQGWAVPKSILFSEQKFLLLNKLEEEFKEELTKKQRAAVSREIHYIISFTPDVVLKTRVAKIFLKNARREQTSVSRKNVKILTSYPLEVFQDKKILSLMEEIIKEKKASNFLLLLCGFSNDERFVPLLESYANTMPKSNEYKGTRFWNAQLALARFGKPKQVSFIVDYIKEYPDKKIAKNFMNDLSYLKREEALNLLLIILNSEEIVDAGHSKTLLAFSAASKLKKTFPALNNGENIWQITKEDLEEIRIYFKSNPKIEFDHTNFW